MNFTLYVVFHGLIALLPGANESRHVVMPDVLTPHEENQLHCDRHEATLLVRKGICTSSECPEIGPMTDALIDLGLSELLADAKAVNADKLVHVWPLSSDLGRPLVESPELAGQLILEGGTLETCTVQELEDKNGNRFSPEFTMQYPQRSARNNRSSLVAESVLWTRSIEAEVLNLAVSNPEATLEIAPEDCGAVGNCIVLWISNPGVNNDKDDCKTSLRFVARHFRHYLPLFDFEAVAHPVVPIIPTRVDQYPTECASLPPGTAPPHRPRQDTTPQPGMFRPAAVSQPPACPIVQ